MKLGPPTSTQKNAAHHPPQLRSHFGSSLVRVRAVLALAVDFVCGHMAKKGFSKKALQRASAAASGGSDHSGTQKKKKQARVAGRKGLRPASSEGSFDMKDLLDAEDDVGSAELAPIGAAVATAAAANSSSSGLPAGTAGSQIILMCKACNKRPEVFVRCD